MSEEADRVRAEYAAEVTAAVSAFDKLVVYLASGGLALSITFVHDIASSPVKHSGRLGVAWVGFTASLLFALLSFLTAEHAHRHQIKELDRKEPENLHLGFFDYATHTLNVLAAVGVAVGAGCFAYFAFANL